MPSAAKDDQAKGFQKPNDIDLTFRAPLMFEERERIAGGMTSVFFVADMEYSDGTVEEMLWEVAPVDFLNDRDSGQPRAFVDDGKFLDAEDFDEPKKRYRIASNSEFGVLVASLEDLGVSKTITQRFCAEPELFEGIKIHAVQIPTGRSYTAKKGAHAGESVEVTALGAEKLIENPHEKKHGTASKPAPAAGKAAPAPTRGRAAAKPEPEEEVEEESDDNTDEIPADELETIELVQTILSDPKKNGVRSYSPKENDGGVTRQQLGMAILSAKTKNKTDKAGLINDPKGAFGKKYSGQFWNYDGKTGVFTAL